MTTPQITKQQQTILTHLYQYRFLNRTQIQSFLNHKTHNRINSWLKNLYENNFVKRIYSSNFGENTKPAIYSVGPNGIRFLKSQANLPPEQVRKLYRESDRSENFVNRCVMLADICLTLRAAASTGGASGVTTTYTFSTAADIADAENELHLLQHMKLQLIITKQEGPSSHSYSAIEVFDPTIPNYAIRNRLRAFLGLYDDWARKIGEHFPSLLIICPTKAGMIYAKRYAKKLLDEIERPNDLKIRFTTVDKLKASGATGEIWESA